MKELTSLFMGGGWGGYGPANAAAAGAAQGDWAMGNENMSEADMNWAASS